MAVKILISGEANAGKTTLIKGLKNALLMSHDGKRPAVPIPNVYIMNFSSIIELVSTFNEKIEAYNEKYGNYPEIIILDSISRIYETIYNNCSGKFSGYQVFSNMDAEIKLLNDYIENTLIASGMDVVMISHALYDSETSQYNLVGKGSYAKLGGALSTVEYAIFLEKKASKRIAHHRSTKFPARTLISDTPDSQDVDAFSMQDYIEAVRASQSDVDSFSL